MAACGRLVCLGLGCKLTVPCGPLLDHTEYACVVARAVVGGRVCGAVVYGAEVGADVPCVRVGVGAGVRGNAPHSWLEFIEGALKYGNCGPPMGVYVEVTVNCSCLFHVSGIKGYRLARTASRRASSLCVRLCRAKVLLWCCCCGCVRYWCRCNDYQCRCQECVQRRFGDEVA